MYHLLKNIVGFVFRFCFQKIVIIDRNKIPKDRPCLVVCNHPSGFLEPCVLACYIGVPLYFLVRGDIFENKIIRWLLESTHQIPIFRFRDGMAGMKKNKESIRYVIELLQENKHLLVFAEGSTKQVRYIRPLQKGTAKIAYEALQDNPNTNLAIVPIGMTLTRPATFRGQVIVKVGDPIDVSDYKTALDDSSPKGIRQMTMDIKTAMVQLVPHIDNKNHSDILDMTLDLFPVFRNPKSIFPIVTYQDTGAFAAIDKSSRYVDQLDEGDDTLTYSDQVNIVQPYLPVEGKKKIVDYIKLVVLGIPAFLGFILIGLPAYFAKKMADAKVKEVEFYTSIWLAASLGFYFLYILILVIVCFSIFGKISILGFFVLPLLGFITVQWIDSYANIKSRFAFDSKNDTEKQSMMATKNLLMQQIN